MIETPIPIGCRAARRRIAIAGWIALLAGAAACGASSQQMPRPATAGGERTTENVPPAVPFPAGTAPAGERMTKLLRYPDIHDDLIVFTYAGDLWLVSARGGTASRLTAHPGLELFPKFSPDGQWVAFTGQYGGDEQVYVVSVGGGVPRQLTYYPAEGPLPARWGYDNQVYGWSSDGTQVLFRSLRDSFDVGESRLYTVPATGGPAVALPMPMAGAGDLAPGGKRVVYSPLFRDFRTWKRYAGGWAQDLYVFDLESVQARRITSDPRSDRDPMWIGDSVYFTSDRDGTSNLYRYDLDGGALTQVTHYQDWDVRWPSADARGHIVFELDGTLHVLDANASASAQPAPDQAADGQPADGQPAANQPAADQPAPSAGHAVAARQVAIYVPDDGTTRRPERVTAAKHIESFALSPGGERALFVARGDVFTAPVEHGLVRNLTHSSNAHDREADWAPDGSYVVYVSDWTGEEELWVVDHRGQEPPRQLTRDSRARLYRPRWSPDGQRIAYSDQRGKIYVIPTAGGRAVEVADQAFGNASDYTWSPDGRYLAFSLSEPTGLASIHVWSADSGRSTRITDPMFHEHTPVWHPQGTHLYYLSTRQFQPQLGQVEWNYVVNRGTVILALALSKDAPHPFAPRNDEVGQPDKPAGAAGAGKPGAGAPGKRPLSRVRIDFDGLAERVSRVPVEADNYEGLTVTDTHLLYVKRDAFFYGREPVVKPVLQAFSFEERKAADLVAGVKGWSAARDGKSVLVQVDSTYKVHALGQPGPQAAGAAPGAAGAGDGDKTIAVDRLVVQRVPAEEWQVVFNETWRRFRDFFYVDNMHGYDWKALGDKYRPLLQHVAHRSDLNYLIGEMIGELNVSHAYVAGGDEKLPARPSVALLGARFALERASGRYRIERIFPGQNAETRYRSPLTEVGVDVAEGDYLLAINGQELDAKSNPYQLLQLPAGQPVELLVGKKPSHAGARTVIVEPLASENDLIYLGWVNANRRKVAQATEGRVGYLHVPDMGADGIREFIKWYYGQVRKEGLIIDVRGNGGGNVSQMLIERLRRTLMGVDFARNADHVWTYPSVVFHGHMVALINETSASDGDIFPWMFRQAGLGPLIGKRSWGGVIGITDHGPLIDGGQAYVPEFGNAAADGQWAIEGVGVSPDIEVDNDPVSLLQGRDPQLERAIDEVLRRMRETPRPLPARPAAPVKTPTRTTRP